MDQQTVLWILGAAVTILVAVVSYIGGRIGKVEERLNLRVDAVAKDVADLNRHLADNFVRGHEIAEVKRLVETIRSDMAAALENMRTEVQHQVNELTKAVYQLIGKN